MSELVLVSPGGIQVGTDEVFTLITHLESLSRQAQEVSNELAHPGSSYRPEGYGHLHRVAGGLEDDLRQLVATLVDYTERVARQEAWRSRLWEQTRDHWWRALVSLGTGSSPRTGERPDAALDDAAATLLGAEGAYRPTVSVTEMSQRMGQPIARGLAERIARIPDSDSPIRIERYLLPSGQWHTEVFVAGTRSWDLEQTDDPFDMRSNLALVAGLPAAAAMATEKAMARAGVRRGDRVLFVGHSQGGAVAASLAESGRYDTRGLLTIGAPLGNQPVRGDYPAIRIEHRDDLVVDLGGYRQPGGQWVVEAESGADPGDVAAAHGRVQYLETAARIDDADISELGDLDHDIPAVRGRVAEFDAWQSLSGDAAAGGKTVR